MYPIVTVILTLISIAVDAKTYNNKMASPPEVICGPDRIEIRARTESPFEGVAFVKNWRRTDGCFRQFEQRDAITQTPTFSIPIDDSARCGLHMRRHRITKELEIFTIFVFSFHPNFVTIGDRAFAIHCVFQQQAISVAANIDFISEINTRGVIGATASLPTVALKIIPGRTPDVHLDAASTVRVGDPLTFIWNLPLTSDVYGIRVRDCNVETQHGRRHRIIVDGCSLDSAAIGNVTYSTDMSTAFADALAFKFPDLEEVWFRCTVALCIKLIEAGEDDADGGRHNICQHSPKCSSPHRYRRQVMGDDPLYTASIDEMAVDQRLYVIDSFKSKNHHQANTTTSAPPSSPSHQQPSRSSSICMRKSLFALISSACITAVSATIILVAIVMIMFARGRIDTFIIGSASTINSNKSSSSSSLSST